MSVITIREQQQTATGFAASLSFGDGEYDIIITDPFTPQGVFILGGKLENHFPKTLSHRSIEAVFPNF